MQVLVCNGYNLLLLTGDSPESFERVYRKEEVDKEIEQLKKKKEWISVKDRLPEHESNCDVYSTNGHRYTDVLYVDYSDSMPHFYHEESDSLIYMEDVTHWMLLSQPSIQQALKEGA